MKFKDWFRNKLEVGRLPYRNNDDFFAVDFDYIINVSDEYYSDIHDNIMEENLKAKYFWFPMNEVKKDIGLNSLYGAMTILYEAEKKNKTVYLHCHAGVNRSQATKAAYYFMRTGEQLEVSKEDFKNRLLAMSSRGYLPPKRELEKFLGKIGENLKSGKMCGGMLDICKIRTIQNF